MIAEFGMLASRGRSPLLSSPNEGRCPLCVVYNA